MKNYKYQLEPYKGSATRYTCPECQKNIKSFTRYIDSITGKYLDPSVGRCNREIECGYHFTPKQYLAESKSSFDSNKTTLIRKRIDVPKKPISFTPFDIFKETLTGFDGNYFINFLECFIGTEKTDQIVKRYFLGTSNFPPGSTIFWQIDQFRKIRGGKIILYNSQSGKRVKGEYSHPTWFHSIYRLEDYNLSQCFFGEHLLIDNDKTVAIVESEKTACICSVFKPEIVWLASGGVSQLSSEKCKVLKGRKVILYPDLGAFDKWKKIADKENYNISSYLEKIATPEERACGLDLADYLINFDPKLSIGVHKSLNII